MGDDERRKHDRLSVALWAMETADDAAYFHYITELSPGGLFLEKRLPLPVGSKVQLEFELPTGATIKCEGSVVRAGDDENQGNGVARHEFLADQKCLSKSAWVRLHCVTYRYSPLATVAEKTFKRRPVLRRSYDQDFPNTSQHQNRQRIVDHRLVIYRHQLLAN